MSASVALSAAALAQSSAALAIAEQARVEACKGFMATFDNKSATVAEIQQYASCVSHVYPDPATGSEIMAFKILFVLALIGMVGGIIYIIRDGVYEWTDYIIGAAMGFIALPIGAGAIFGLFYGIYWLFT